MLYEKEIIWHQETNKINIKTDEEEKNHWKRQNSSTLVVLFKKDIEFFKLKNITVNLRECFCRFKWLNREILSKFNQNESRYYQIRMLHHLTTLTIILLLFWCRSFMFLNIDCLSIIIFGFLLYYLYAI